MFDKLNQMKTNFADQRLLITTIAFCGFMSFSEVSRFLSRFGFSNT